MDFHQECINNLNLYSLCYSCEGTANQETLQKQLQLSASSTGEASKINKSTNTDLENPNILKLQELRELETKLKKKEHELQLREKTLTDNSKEVNKLNSYIKKIENEKLEYERTIQTLIK